MVDMGTVDLSELNRIVCWGFNNPTPKKFIKKKLIVGVFIRTNLKTLKTIFLTMSIMGYNGSHVDCDIFFKVEFVEVKTYT